MWDITWWTDDTKTVRCGDEKKGDGQMMMDIW